MLGFFGFEAGCVRWLSIFGVGGGVVFAGVDFFIPYIEGLYVLHTVKDVA